MRLAQSTSGPQEDGFRRDPAGRRSWLAPEARRGLQRIGQRILTFYWIACLSIIGLGAARASPETWLPLTTLFRDPALDLAEPFPSCAAAHEAGYYDIPRRSAAYTPRQDKDGDGYACEPPPVARGRLFMASLRQLLR